MFYRYDKEKDKTFAYVGQAKHLLNRLVQHLMAYDNRIDISLKKRKLKDGDTGEWELDFFNVAESQLNEMERSTIGTWQNVGAELYNITAGGQDVGKHDLDGSVAERKPTKKYMEGLRQGYARASADVASWAKHFRIEIDGNPTKVKVRLFERFNAFKDGKYNPYVGKKKEGEENETEKENE